ncbi:MAG: tyrosine--tRNA ligase, partial [Synergistaceae bacterium]|nr:tyrosine--tRNA ligase [Synergistaceae bacterium]
LEVTTTVHGAETAKSVINASEILFNPKIDFAGVSEETCEMLKQEVPYKKLEGFEFPASAVSVLASSGACESNGEAKRAIRQGGVSINGEKISDEKAELNREALINGKYLFVRVGKKKFNMAEFN